MFVAMLAIMVMILHVMWWDVVLYTSRGIGLIEGVHILATFPAVVVLVGHVVWRDLVVLL